MTPAGETAVSWRAGLRPLTTPEILDAGLNLLARQWQRTLGLAALTALPPLVLTLGYVYWLGTVLRGEDARYHAGTVAWSLLMAAAWMAHGIGRGALTAALLAEARGTAWTAGACWRRALRTAPSLALVAGISPVAAWLGAPCLFVLAFLPLSAWFVARPAVIDQDCRYLAALERSSALTRGQRGKAVRLWFGLLLVCGVAALNAYGLILFALSGANTFLGYDVGAWEAVLSYRNLNYLLWLGAALFLLLDPYKTSVDTVFYLDLRIRRDGADLQARLRSLGGVAPAALAILLMAGVLPTAGASTADEYRRAVEQLRQQVSRAPDAGQIDPAPLTRLDPGPVRMPDGSRVSADQVWLRSAPGWKDRVERQAVLDRLTTLSRQLDAPATPSGTTAPAAPPAAEAETAYRAAMARPEFQELADRPELDRLASRLNPGSPTTWFERLWGWIRQFAPGPGESRGPAPAPSTGWNPRLAQRVVYVLLSVAGAILLAFVLRALFGIWQQRGSSRPAAAATAALEDSQTENALEHPADRWEAFAAEWLRRGDLRQAVRALYLALLVELHDRRLIDYNRAFTNWHYVRQFAGPVEHRPVLRSLTDLFDRAWYGRIPCSEEQFRSFEAGVRSLAGGPLLGGNG